MPAAGLRRSSALRRVQARQAPIQSGVVRARPCRVHSGAPHRAGGYTYLSLLFFIALAGVGLAHFGTLWHLESRRDREKELLFIGEQFRRAIAAYYDASPGGAKQFPKSLEDLLEDKRDVTARRYLRRIYPDPLTGVPTWGLVKTPDGQHIMGVYSLFDGTPVKGGGFAERYASFALARSYGDWKFAFAPTTPAQVAAGGPAVPQTPAVVVDGGEASPTPTPVSLPTAMPQPAAEPPKPKSRCEKIAEADLQACHRLGQRFDAEEETHCLRSAQDRATACEQGRSALPSLYIRYR